MEKLPEYLDRLINVAWTGPMDYNTRRKVIPRTTAYSIRNYIEDEVTGRPHPLDDSSDHMLLVAFHALREQFLDRPVPENTGFYGSVYHSNGQRSESDCALGEIPWRNRHVEPCSTCQRPTDEDAFTCSNPCHLNIRTHMMADQPGVYRSEITRTLPLREGE